MPKLSLVIAVYNEEENVIPLTQKVAASLEGYDYELIYVDDGSKDCTVANVLSLKDPNVVLVKFKQNYGQSNALAAGIDYATGDYIITLDGDMQNDPADIPMMVRKAEEEGWDLVAGIRKNRKDDFFLRKIPSRIANRIIRRATGVKMKDNGCALKVFRSDIAKNISLYGELHRFIAVLAALEGATIAQVDVNHYPRVHGKSKYGLNRTFKVISDLMLLLFFKRYLSRPMHFFGTWGLVILIPGILINLYMLILKIMGHDIWGRPLLILGILLLVAGFQMITSGIIAELLMRTYYESQKKKPYRIQNIFKGGRET